MMRVLTLAAALALTSATAAWADSYGAIALDPQAGAYGVSIHSTKAEAESRATAECKAHGGGSACDEQVWVHNGCVALAAASKTAWGIGAKGNKEDAKAGAIRKCVETGGTDATCKLDITFCVD